MAGLNSWLSPAVLHALGWALIHSLWQGAAVAALAALALAFIHRPALRYLIGVGALALMLAAPVATFLVLAKPAAPVPVLQPGTVSLLPAMPPLSMPVAALATADRAIGAIREAPRQLPVTDLLPWLVAAWACGVAFFSLRFAGGFLLLEHRRRTGSHLPGEPVLALCLDLQSRLGLDRAIQYLECGWVEAPAVIGWLRPAVLLPVFALTGLSEEQFRAVIAHELAHIRRHDWLVNLFQVLVESLLFYHPAMWWLNRRIRIERELCCDEIAVSLTGSRLEYARALTQMAEWKNVSLLAMAANRGPLTQRILHILGRKPGAGQRVAGLTGGMLFLAAALAAANLLFGIAYPVQMAEAKESVRVALVSSQSAVADLARQVVLTAKDAALPTVAPDQKDAAAESKADALAVPPPDLSRLLPNQTLATPTVVASNAPSSIRAPAGDTGANSQEKVIHCSNTSVFGRVLSSEAVQLQGFNCISSPNIPNTAIGPEADVGVSFSSELRFGSCPNASTDPSTPAMTSRLGRAGHPCPFDVQMNVRLAERADMAKMQPGKMVRLAGEFQVIRQGGQDYLSVTNARVIWTDPFDRQAANAPPTGGHLLQYCFDASGFSMTGLVTASNEIRFGKFSCGDFRSFVDVTAYVQFADPADAAKMRPGEALTLKGNVYVWTRNNRYWLIIQNAKVLRDPFFRAEPDPDRQAANASSATTPDDQAIALVSAAAPGQAGARARTEPYLGCYLGFGSWTCPSYLVTPLWWCGEEYAQRQARDCPEGPLKQVDYLGTNAAGADVYAVKFRNVDMTYVIAPPGPDGKKGSMWIRRGNPNGNASSLVAVISRAGAGLIYKRTATDGGAQANPSDRHAANAPPATTPVDQPVAPPATTRELAAGPVQAALRTLPATPAKLDSHEPYKITKCKNVSNGTGLCDLVTLASAAPARQASATRARTELAMKCWLGVVGYKGCWPEKTGGCEGALGVKSVEYLGRTTAGVDAYQVRYMERIAAYAVTPDPKGSADQYLVKAVDHYWIKKEISPPATPTLIYTKPENAPPAGCGGGDFSPP